MSAARGGVEEHELNALLDGRLPPERAAAVDAYLAAHPGEKARLQQYQEQQQGLRSAFAAQSDEPIPTRLRVGRLLAEQRGRRHWQLAATAAAGGVLGVGGGGGGGGRGWGRGPAAAAVVLLALGGIGGWAARDWSTRLPSPDQHAQAAATER